jgi:hypothetical protein
MAFVICRRIVNTAIGKGFNERLAAYGIPVLNGTYQRVAYAESASEGQTVMERDPNGPAACEIADLPTEIRRHALYDSLRSCDLPHPHDGSPSFLGYPANRVDGTPGGQFVASANSVDGRLKTVLGSTPDRSSDGTAPRHSWVSEFFTLFRLASIRKPQFIEKSYICEMA